MIRISALEKENEDLKVNQSGLIEDMAAKDELLMEAEAHLGKVQEESGFSREELQKGNSSGEGSGKGGGGKKYAGKSGNGFGEQGADASQWKPGQTKTNGWMPKCVALAVQVRLGDAQAAEAYIQQYEHASPMFFDAMKTAVSSADGAYTEQQLKWQKTSWGQTKGKWGKKW